MRSVPLDSDRLGNQSDCRFMTCHIIRIIIVMLIQNVGCDHVINSGSITDRCMECLGNGSTCVRVEGSYDKLWNRWGMYVTILLFSDGL